MTNSENNFFVKRVFLVDDSEADNYTHKSFIELSHFAEEVFVFNEGNEALAYIEQNRFNGELLPDVIFLDLHMPLISGFDFLAEFEKFSEQILNKCKVVILSTSESPKDIYKMANNTIVKDYVYKPLTRKELDKLRTSLKFYLDHQED